MQKTLKIGDKEIRFEFAAVTSVLYEQEFGRDYFADLAKFYKLVGNENGLETESDFFKLSKETLNELDFSFFSTFAWACAKTANDDIGGFIEWLRDNPDFDRIKHGSQVMDLIKPASETKKK